MKIGEILADADERIRAAVLDAYRKSGASQRGTAEILGCHEASVSRWITKLGIENEIAAIRREATEEGWRTSHAGGRPRHNADRGTDAGKTNRSRGRGSRRERASRARA